MDEFDGADDDYDDPLPNVQWDEVCGLFVVSFHEKFCALLFIISCMFLDLVKSLQ